MSTHAKTDGWRYWALFAWMTAMAAGPVAAEVASHRGLYRVDLAKSRDGAISDARGAMAIAFEKTCDGWIMTQRMQSVMTMASGKTINQEVSYTGWESLDGATYRFAARSAFGDQEEAFRGSADRGGVTYRIPAKGTVSLPPETIFPMGHTRQLIDRARAGEQSMTRIVFDGTESLGPRRITAFIGRAIAAGEREGADLGPLAAGPGWSMRLAFYAVDSRDGVPDYEITMEHLDNGVVPRLILDYPEFQMVASMRELEPIPPPDC